MDEVRLELQPWNANVHIFNILMLREKKVKNVLFIHNSMQFHTFFPCGAIPTGSFFVHPSQSFRLHTQFTSLFRTIKFSTWIIVRDSCVFIWSRFECNHFPHSTISHRAIMNWSQIIIHPQKNRICMQCDFSMVDFPLLLMCEYTEYWFMLRLSKSQCYTILSLPLWNVEMFCTKTFSRIFTTLTTTSMAT